MLEELVKSIEKVKSIFNLDEIEKSLYFVNQSTILSERLALLKSRITICMSIIVGKLLLIQRVLMIILFSMKQEGKSIFLN